jgi:hypothetical protein
VQSVKFLSMVRQSDILRGDNFYLNIEHNLEHSAVNTVRFSVEREANQALEKIAIGVIIFKFN